MAELLHFPVPAPRASTPAHHPPDVPPDQEARSRALDIQTSSIVEAPAGSGKTGLLLQRYLKLLAEGHVDQPEEVLAITFTRKATAELRKRVLDELHNAAASIPLPPTAGAFKHETRALAEAVLGVDARLHWQLLDQPQRLRIRTIDSLCAEIAHTLPLLSGSVSTQPVEEVGPLYREAARRTLMQLGGSDVELNTALRTVLLHRDANLDDCESLLARMLEQREQWGELVPLEAATLTDDFLDRQIRPRLERTLESIVCAALTRALEALPPGLLADLTTLAARLGLQPGYNGSGSPISLCADRNQPPSARVEDLEHWIALIHLLLKPSDHNWRARFHSRDLGVNISKADAALLQQLVEGLQCDDLREILRSIRALPSPRYPDEQWIVAKALFRLLRHALAQLKVLFAETNQCDFAELSLAARTALAALSTDDTRDDLAGSPGTRLTHLLVDEMQDTSSSQYILLELLTRSWDGHSQTLFLVGDPRQSIYLFRQARVERFLRTLRERRLGDIPLQPLQLTANFRSQGALVESFNETFVQVFPAQTSSAAAHDVPFVHADAVRTPTRTAISWHANVLGDGLATDAPKPSSAELRAVQRRRDARAIRRIIEDWRARPLPSDRHKRSDGNPAPWRIAVLARARTHLHTIIAELSRDLGPDHPRIPFRAVEIDSLAERPEVLDALALTRALLHPADRTAWLAVLRAPWCGLSLADLLTLTGEGPLADVHATLPELVAANRSHLSLDGQLLLARTWPVLEAALETLGRSSLAVHVERTWRSLGGDAPLTPEQQTNVRRFLQILRELEADGGRAVAGSIDLTLLSARLEHLYAEPAADGAVELLTIHKAKGLEFDVVLVPDLDRPSRQSSSELLNWLELDSTADDAAHVLLAPIWSRGADSDRLNQWLRRVKRDREYAEIKRLLYVACTRAMEELHLFAASARNNDTSLRRPAPGTLLHASWAVAQQHFNTAAAPATPDLAAALRNSLATLSPSEEDLSDNTTAGLALAASADPAQTQPAPQPPLIHRLPLSFDPLARFTAAETTRLPYTPASSLIHTAAFDRPEGSFAVRAFGNVVHRFLEILSTRLERDHPDALLAELPAWEPRLLASLRGEGLPPTQAQRDAPRALTALRNALTDPVGRWILSPHPAAASERSLATSASAVFRADRSFLSGSAPLSAGDTHLWIVDFKTTEQGARSSNDFAEQEILKYRDQLEHYAAICRALPASNQSMLLGLYYPLVPCLLHWPAAEPSQP
ncbi:MAG TPA: UvrD-helicase domain-containing protein [Acidobacteriaceae bacterium]|jgi:ATP-dependent exoDNAse (exonuclease V) beta subunit|nr:UvrD-helicase domain-containing protein [Acidobacteriaceae bacterium]